MDDFPDSLDLPLETFRTRLYECVDLIVARYRTLDAANAHAGIAETTVRGWFDEPLPRAAMDLGALLARVDETVIAHPTMNLGTRMFAYVMSGGNHVSVMADLIASALDQNVAKWHLAPAMTEIERRVIAWTAAFVGLSAHAAGAIVASGSAANLTGLTIARNVFAERLNVRERGLYAMAPLVVYASEETHSSVAKSIELLGLGSANYRHLPTREDFTLDCDALAAAIDADRTAGLTPFCVVGNAGTVNTGAIDPLDTIAGIAQDAGLWFHVDGAYGGLAAALAAKRGLYRGIERADSVALDYHKWLYQPYEVGCTLVRDWDTLRRTYHTTASYLEFGVAPERFDVSRHHFDLSRNAKAFKVWMSFKAYGADRLAAMIEKDIALADYLARRLDASADFELSSHGPLGIVCFRHLADTHGDEDLIDQHNVRLIAALEQDGRVFITGTELRGRRVLRACIINHRCDRAAIDALLDVIRDVAAGRAASPV